jgi:hypothetical protein
VWEGWKAGSLAFHAFHTLSFPWPAFETRVAKSQSLRKPVLGSFDSGIAHLLGAPDEPRLAPTTLRTQGREYGRAASTDTACLASVSALLTVSRHFSFELPRVLPEHFDCYSWRGAPKLAKSESGINYDVPRNVPFGGAAESGVRRYLPKTKVEASKEIAAS